MNVQLTPEQEQFVQQRLESGRYSHASDVVSDAFALLAEREAKLEWLRNAIQEGLDSGTPEPWEGAEELIRQFSESQNSSQDQSRVNDWNSSQSTCKARLERYLDVHQ